MMRRIGRVVSDARLAGCRRQQQRWRQAGCISELCLSQMLQRSSFRVRAFVSEPLPSFPPCLPSTLQELAEERERAAKAKELEVARLRAMQEKIIDNRAAIVSRG